MPVRKTDKQYRLSHIIMSIRSLLEVIEDDSIRNDLAEAGHRIQFSAQTFIKQLNRRGSNHQTRMSIAMPKKLH